MNQMISGVNFIAANYQAIVSSIVTVLSGVIGICLLIPGDAPEKQLQAIVDFLSKFSVKNK